MECNTINSDIKQLLTSVPSNKIKDNNNVVIEDAQIVGEKFNKF